MRVYHQYDLVNSGDNASEQTCAPFFQSLAHNGMVRIVAGLLYDIERLAEGHTLFEHEYPDKLGYCNGGVCVVELERIAFRKFGEVVSVGFLIASDNVLNGSGHKEILLLEP